MKLAIRLLASSFVFVLAACGGGNAPGSDNAADQGGGGAGGGALPTGGAGGEGATSAALADQTMLSTSDRVVPPGGEIYACQDFANPFGKDVAIVQSDSAMTKGSHHMFAFVLPSDQLSLFDQLADCPGGGVEFHEYVHTSQIPNDRVTYPDGVGRVFPAAAGFRVMLHLLNTGADPVSAHIDFGMNTVDPDAVAKKAASMFLNNLGLKVPAGTSTAEGVFTLPGDITLLRAVSHMHRHGAGFVATTDTGIELYRGTVWDEPIPRVFDPPLSLAKGTKITWSCDFQNDTGSTLVFGESAAKNEMCIFSASFYDALGYQLNAQYPFF